MKADLSAARAMAAMEPAARARLLWAAEQEMLHEAEIAKQHPLREHRFTAKEFEELCNHLLDGGGVTDRRVIAAAVLTDLLAREQSADFMANLIHLVKSALKVEGFVIPHPAAEDAEAGVSPAVSLPGVGPAFQRLLDAMGRVEGGGKEGVADVGAEHAAVADDGLRAGE